MPAELQTNQNMVASLTRVSLTQNNETPSYERLHIAVSSKRSIRNMQPVAIQVTVDANWQFQTAPKTNIQQQRGSFVARVWSRADMSTSSTLLPQVVPEINVNLESFYWGVGREVGGSVTFEARLASLNNMEKASTGFRHSHLSTRRRT